MSVLDSLLDELSARFVGLIDRRLAELGVGAAKPVEETPAPAATVPVAPASPVAIERIAEASPEPEDEPLPAIEFKVRPAPPGSTIIALRVSPSGAFALASIREANRPERIVPLATIDAFRRATADWLRRGYEIEPDGDLAVFASWLRRAAAPPTSDSSAKTEEPQPAKVRETETPGPMADAEHAAPRPKGRSSPRATIDRETARAIFLEKGTPKEIAERRGLSYWTVWKIKTRRTHADSTEDLVAREVA